MWRFALSRRWWAGHVLVAAGCGLFLGLARWQWDRAYSITGDWQNLGYALQWPLFAVVLFAAWLRFLWLEQHHDLELHHDAADVYPDRADVPPDRADVYRDLAANPAPAPASPPATGAASPVAGAASPVAGAASPVAGAASPTPARGPALREDDPDDELAAYNAYLARLAEQDRR